MSYTDPHNYLLHGQEANLKEIRDIIENWEANRELAAIEKRTEDSKYASAVIFGLTLALGSVKQPCNTQMQIDTEPCSRCSNWLTNHLRINKGKKFCSYCGRALSD